MSQETRAFIAIGSNIEPERHIALGLEALSQIPTTRIGAVSSWYRTRPWGLEAQAEFINLVVEVWTRLTPSALLAATQGVENRLGRIRAQVNGPRTLDLDILLYGERVDDMPELRLPHPGLLLRDFMLIPLLEIAPEVMHPERGHPIAELTDEIRYHQIIDRIPDASQAHG
ncbi:2-amino-4-hydroxy-6-hydroxymethyldihydropteridine diphosphokinase [Allochromatium vinosum]|uniref:2-amino-4-hydroxy-6-hydroxymethyldihydropteridine pyrophosphokinase n=1 Tax=Allochromatium vinosum (strain ATCC 17899 / DSM 180 / NBRC 103801 / NCIMB 10441 / D) TaxID=572477 RepID=D3RUG3_ALLVD|nr:2-amino-4-hydroxy-6-hydroxymethyldihydropteridine diphosphokinase [Allochromatium vinosum]ADC62822.1 2-amino-4-hydroxy-6-hydroxymethyldihydropteridine pyrophosphokinase [Allochromatium vinosum DSM 180]